MIKLRKREMDNSMFASPSTKEMLSNLKGRISKVLTFSRKLSEEEKIVLEGIYNTIDEVILWNKKLTKNKATRFKGTFKQYVNLVEDSKKVYIQKHIIPVLKKVIEQEWVSNE